MIQSSGPTESSEPTGSRVSANERLFDLEGSTSEAAVSIAQASVSDVLYGLRTQAEFFIEFFLAEQLEFEVPRFHVEVWERLTDTDESRNRVLLAIPREHAKTTLAKLAVIWYFLFSRKRFCVYLSNTSPIAKNACRDIMEFLKTPNFTAVFGDIVMEKESETDGLWIFQMPIGYGKFKRCILRSAGANQQMRGINIDNQRPDIAVVDDVEDMSNTESPTLQAKLDRWIFGTFLKALARDNKVIWLGNMLQKTSLLARLSKRPNWNPVVFGALVRRPDGKGLMPLWPDLWPMQKLINDFREYADLGLIDTWMCEMMNMPGHGQNGFTQDQIRYRPRPLPEQLLAAFITIDPAFGQQKGIHDDTAIVVHGILHDGSAMIVDYRTGKMTEDEMFDEAMSLAMHWNAWVWGIEAIAAQSVLLTLFSTYAMMRHVQDQIIMMPLKSGRGDPKQGRIRAWVNSMKGGIYALPEDDYHVTMQILNYDLSKKDQSDDLIDACAYGLPMLDSYKELILAHTANITAKGGVKVRYGMEVASA